MPVMELEEEEVVIYPQSQKWAKTINLFMFCVHFVLLVVFGMLSIMPMVAFNAVSLLVYEVILPKLQTKPRLYITVLYVEVLVHMVFAIAFAGWDCGFQLYAFFMIPFAFYANYVLIEDDAPSYNPLVPSVLFTFAFIICSFIYDYLGVSGAVTGRQAATLFLLNSIGLLGALIFITYTFLNGVLDSVRKVMHTAEYDELTGLANRHQIDKLLKLHDIGGEHGEEHYGIAILDIDNFKKVNDKYGHLAGDHVLYDIAVILRSVESKDTFVFRWGGEEFMILTLGSDATAGLVDVCEHVRKLVSSNTTVVELHRIGVTVSIGCTKANARNEEFSAVTKRADDYLYFAKGNGKNQVVCKDE